MKQQGFTLLEVLIAASIFASIMLIAVASFTKMNQLNDRAREVRAVAETGRFMLDNLVRAISAANGQDTKAGDATTPKQSLSLCTGPTLINPASADAPATKLVTATSDAAGAVTVRAYYPDPATKTQLLEQVTDPITGAAPASPLNTSEVTVSNVAFSGVSATSGASAQPYVTIDLDITAVPLRPGIGTITQHFRTSVVSRDYAVGSHGNGNLCSYPQIP